MTPEERLFEGASIVGFIILGLSGLGFLLRAPAMGIGCLIVAACILVPLHWPRPKEDNRER